MKYPQSVPMPRDVEDWLEGELEARGIDAVVYTRYILSLMQQDSLDFELSEAWPHLPQAKGVWSGQKRDRSWDQDALKRLAVLRCLMSASSQKCEVESLVDELCVKLNEFKSGAACEGPAFPQPSDSPPYTDYNKAFPPLGGDAEGGESRLTSAWTRGLLRASRDGTATALPYDDTVDAHDYFSLMYCGPRKSYGGYMELLTEQAPAQEAVKRLYERSAERTLDRVIARFDSNIQEIWNPDHLVPAIADGYAQNQAYFYNNRPLFSPSLFAYGNIDEVIPAPVTSWSLGGTTTLPNHKEDESCFKTVAPREVIEEPRIDTAAGGLVEEEDLLTSARTHFRPIPSEDLVPQPPKYADGTTFVISTELEPLQFQRSESGTLFLETGKYMEFKKEDDGEPGVEEFVPKFRVRQSNEKFCQTEDVEMMAALSEEQIPDSPESVSSVSDSDDEFFFPGDDELALDINIDCLPGEDEVAHIVSGRLDVRWKAVAPSPPLADEVKKVVQVEPSWDSDDAALVAELVGEDSNYNYNTQIADDGMEGLDCERGKASTCWPQLTDSIWNPNNPALACNACKQGSFGTEPLPTDKVKQEWQGFWMKPICSAGKEGEDAVLETSSAVVDYTVSYGEERTPVGKGTTASEGGELPGFWTIAPSALTNKNSLEVPVEWNDCGSIETGKANKWRCDETSPGWKWPKLGAALSTYLEESRVRAFEMLSVWSPAHLSEDDKKVEGDLRDLWSPASSTDEVDGPSMTARECREIWSPVVGQTVALPSERPLTYCLLRDELSEDGDQLLSDLSCLHLQQLGSGDIDATEASDLQEEDTFPTAPPSPEWEKGHRFVSLWATWNLMEVIGENNANQDDRPYNSDTAQKERKRRHSSSQKVCELYMEGECRRPHCRFLHGDDVTDTTPSPLFAPRTLHFGRELQRAFTL